MENIKVLTVGDFIAALSSYSKDMVVTVYDIEDQLFYGLTEDDISEVSVDKGNGVNETRLCINKQDVIDDLSGDEYEVNAFPQIINALRLSVESLDDLGFPPVDSSKISPSHAMAAFNEVKAKAMKDICYAIDAVVGMTAIVSTHQGLIDEFNKPALSTDANIDGEGKLKITGGDSQEEETVNN